MNDKISLSKIEAAFKQLASIERAQPEFVWYKGIPLHVPFDELDEEDKETLRNDEFIQKLLKEKREREDNSHADV